MELIRRRQVVRRYDRGRFGVNPANPFASVIPASPTGLKFIPPSDGSSSVITDYNNTTTSKALEFQVTGVTSGNTVEILADGRVVGQEYRHRHDRHGLYRRFHGAGDGAAHVYRNPSRA